MAMKSTRENIKKVSAFLITNSQYSSFHLLHTFHFKIDEIKESEIIGISADTSLHQSVCPKQRSESPLSLQFDALSLGAINKRRRQSLGGRGQKLDKNCRHYYAKTADMREGGIKK